MANPAQATTEIDVDGLGGAIAPSDQYQDFPVDPAEEQQRSHADVAAALAGVIGRLQALADRQVQLKAPIEQRWLDDMRQLHGRYPVKTEEDLRKAHKSKLFVNITRTKVNAWEARLTDLLFPTDDKNWGIKPVPAPHLSAAIRDSIKIANQAADDATAAHQAGNPALGQQIAAQGQTAVEAGVSIQQEIEAADLSADLMEQEIDSQLKDADYNIRCREVIRSAIKLGTGILKGPVTNNRLKRSWIKESEQKAPATQSPFANFRGRSAELAASQTALSVTGAAPGPAPDGFSPANDAPPATGGMMQPSHDLRAGLPTYQPQQQPAQPQPVNVDAQAQGTGYVLDLQPDPAPEGVWVDPWNYFPDMSANRVENKEFDFERHLWNPKQLRAAVRESGLDPEAVSRLLREGSRTQMPTYWATLREITSNSNVIGTESRFHVWEYTGVLEDEDLQALADATKDQTVIDFVRDNPLLEVPVIIWFCQGELLKFAPYPLDSCESIYSIFNFEEDETSLFGFGVPYLMRDSQSAINGAWRMMMDNGGLSVGPQIVVDNGMVQPADGDWGLRSMKVWLKNSSSLTNKLPDSYKPFEAIQITANQAQLQAIIGLAEGFADKETNMPLIAEGGVAGGITKTTGGMSMLMNAANVVFRRVVRNYDDTISSPFIRRMYDWNMQFNKRDDIKGNYAIDARGSSVLLVKEMQTQTLMSALQNFGAHPVFGPMLKGAQLLRHLFAAQMIRADDAVKSDDEIKQDAQARAQAAAQQQPQTGKSQAELAAEVQMNRDNNLAKVQVAGMEQKTALIVLAGKLNMDVKKLQAELAINDADIQHRERLFAAELANQTPDEPPHDFAGPGIKV